MKFFFNIIIIVFLAVALYRTFVGGQKSVIVEDSLNTEVVIKTYDKNIDISDIKVTSVKNEVLTDNKNSLKNKPQQIKDKKKKETISDKAAGDGHSLIQGRIVIGGDFTPLRNISQNYVFENEVNPDWKNLAIKEFMDDDDQDAQIDIHHLDSQVYLRDGTALFIEKVRIKVAESDGLGGEFNAYIDSSTGEVLHAWDPSNNPFEDFKMSEDSMEEEFDDFSPEFTDEAGYDEEYSSQ
ncbi:MAG: hypothetical protein OEY33_07730 [Bdellovibrionales bacterium]|jgi:hypothetical protein|nr:hypothetical protein [Bdellovibrionales bacterium]